MDVQPFKVVRDFAEGEIAVGNLCRALVPVWIKPVPEPEPSSNSRPVHPKVPAVGRDIAMDSDATILGSTQLQGKAKGRAEDVEKG